MLLKQGEMSRQMSPEQDGGTVGGSGAWTHNSRVQLQLTLNITYFEGIAFLCRNRQRPWIKSYKLWKSVLGFSLLDKPRCSPECSPAAFYECERQTSKNVQTQFSKHFPELVSDWCWGPRGAGRAGRVGGAGWSRAEQLRYMELTDDWHLTGTGAVLHLAASLMVGAGWKWFNTEKWTT